MHCCTKLPTIFTQRMHLPSGWFAYPAVPPLSCHVRHAAAPAAAPLTSVRGGMCCCALMLACHVVNSDWAMPVLQVCGAGSRGGGN